jgi:hypothetical protein
MWGGAISFRPVGLPRPTFAATASSDNKPDGLAEGKNSR